MVIREVFVRVVVMRSVLHYVVDVPIRCGEARRRALFRYRVVGKELRCRTAVQIGRLLERQSANFRVRVVALSFSIHEFQGRFILRFKDGHCFIRLSSNVFRCCVRGLLSYRLRYFIFVASAYGLRQTIFLGWSAMATVLIKRFCAFIVSQVRRVRVQGAFSLQIYSVPLRASPLNKCVRTSRRRHRRGCAYWSVAFRVSFRSLF